MSVFIIAEAGVNHNGDLHIAKELARVAKQAGANAVKYQTFMPEKLVSRFAEKADYQKRNEEGTASESQLAMLKRLALSYEAFRELHAYCNEIGIEFLTTAFDDESLEFILTLPVRILKIPSGDITNLPFLEKCRDTGLPVILSTGMSTLDEIQDAYEVFAAKKVYDITILHCTTEYPAPVYEVNLRVIPELHAQFGCPVGYSDHTVGVTVPIAAVALGATVIEKHFTLDKTMQGPDHKASLDPNELKELVDAIRYTEIALGSAEKTITLSEEKNRTVARKSIVAACDIHRGQPLTADLITCKRPGNGISPFKWYTVLHTKAIRDFKKDELIEL